MDRFARIVLGYHGCKAGESADFARQLILGEAELDDWRPSQNEFDWLGQGIYFWEHSPERAARWAGSNGVVIGAVIQLGRCLDFTDIHCTQLLQPAHQQVVQSFSAKNLDLPQNEGRELKNRKLDCLVINSCVNSLESAGQTIQTVRCAFEEGDEVFVGAMLKMETHIQVAVRDRNCILGLFRPS